VAGSCVQAAGLAPFVGRAWEDEFRASVLPSQRPVILRTSFVLGRDRGAGSGALARLRMLVRLGLGGTVGPGTQGMSWIHETDLNRLSRLPVPWRLAVGQGVCRYGEPDTDSPPARVAIASHSD
jgi:hypothetical protein